MKLKKLKSFRSIILMLVTFILTSFLTRVLLSKIAIDDAQISFSDLKISIFLNGFLNDLVTFSYIATIFAFLSILIRIKNIKLIYFLYLIWNASLIFNSISEYLFWDEFSTRYNFIAVDYLVYTREVVGNIVESYPLVAIFAGIFFISIILFLILKPLIDRIYVFSIDLKERFSVFIFCLTISFLCFVNYSSIDEYDDQYLSELSKDGLYELFSAFRNNDLDYNNFYPTLDIKDAFSIVKKELKSSKLKFDDISRKVSYKGKLKNYNVILITVESLSAEFLSQFGSNLGITPNLDKIAKESLTFSNYYATGTRTVRGIEAMVLSVPPTPGNSLVRKERNDNLFSISSILSQHGYDMNFIYGGYGYFDNMNNFFKNNGFNIVDRNKIDKIRFSNIWGVCDEDLLDKTIEKADESYKNSKPFFSFVLTTSNHRPYTYPDGKIDIESGTGRHGAVKYTDYSIGEFIKKSKNKPWFNNTIFVITADHCASSSGKRKIPVERYHIPLIIYAPNIVKSDNIKNLTSQIDLAPSILGILNLSYESKFFGQDAINSINERAFMATYQMLGFYENNRLMVLSPYSEPIFYEIKDKKHQIQIINNIDDLYEKGISYYQTADYMFKNGIMKNN